ncbi:hypothetical protein ACET3Z_031419 [Daucus carota]
MKPVKPVSTKTLINFSNSTRVKKIENDDFIIPMHKFELVGMGDLLKIAKSYNNAEQPEFGTDTVQINTVPSSRIYMNLDIDAVIAMCQRLIDEGYTHSEGNTATTTNKTVQQIVETMTLNELSEKITEEYIKKHVFCVVKVISVEENGWWCNSCGGCGSEVEKQDGKLFCTSCDHFIPVAEKRYKVVVLGKDSTEAYKFVLMDRGMKRMLGIFATKMISDKSKVNRRLFFAVDAIDAGAPVSAICSVSGTSSTTSSIGNSAALKLSEVNDTPSTSKSSSKKVKKEP